MVSQKVIESSKILAAKGLTITFIESASAGRMCYEYSKVPESGKILLGGLVCYDAVLKEEILKIPEEVIEKFTPESAQVTQMMAQNFCKVVAADVCVGITGLTTEGGSETTEKPVGTIFLHIIFPHKQVAKRYEFQGNSSAIVKQSIDAASTVIIEELSSFEVKQSFE